jgi:hypothetical protein
MKAKLHLIKMKCFIALYISLKRVKELIILQTSFMNPIVESHCSEHQTSTLNHFK